MVSIGLEGKYIRFNKAHNKLHTLRQIKKKDRKKRRGLYSLSPFFLTFYK